MPAPRPPRASILPVARAPCLSSHRGTRFAHAVPSHFLGPGEHSMTTLTRRDWLRAAALAPAALAVLPRHSVAAPSPADIKAVVDKAAGFLKGTQNEDGSW